MLPASSGHRTMATGRAGGNSGGRAAGSGDSATVGSDGVVTELHFGADHVTDIAPLRALPGLTFLGCRGSNWGKGQLADLLPLIGIDLDTKGSEAGSLTITVDDDGQVATHRISGPTQIYLARTEANLIQWLAIEEEGGRTIVHFEQFPELEADYPEERPPG